MQPREHCATALGLYQAPSMSEQEKNILDTQGLKCTCTCCGHSQNPTHVLL